MGILTGLGDSTAVFNITDPGFEEALALELLGR